METQHTGRRAKSGYQQRAHEIRERYIAFFMKDRDWTREQAIEHAKSYGINGNPEWDWQALAAKGL